MNIVKYFLKTIKKIKNNKNKKNIILPNNNFECPICKDCESNDSLIEIDCNHIYHMLCIKQHIAIKINDNSNIIQCPIDTCKLKISDKIINKLFENNQDILFKFDRNMQKK